MGEMDWCGGLADGVWPNQVDNCGYYRNGGREGPFECDGQFDNAKSFWIVRGEMQFAATYDTYSGQPQDKRCSPFWPFQETWENTKERDGRTVFYREQRCRNAVSGGSWFDLEGFKAWDSEHP